MFIASRWFDDINDLITLETSVRRFYGNLEKFYYNPVSIDETTRKFFPYLQTLHLNKHDDPTFENDPKIIARKEWKHGNLWHNQKEQLEEWTQLK